MRKLLFLVLGIALFTVVNAQSLTVHLEGGKCNKFTEEVTYKTVIAEYDSYRRLTYLECTGKGHEQCPPSWTYDQPQSTFEKSILEATVLMEVQILEDLKEGKTSGEFKYKYITLSYKNASIVKKESNAEELQYDWSITDFRTVRDVSDIKKYKETIEKQKE